MEGETRDSSSVAPDNKQGAMPSKTPGDAVVVSVPLVSHSDVYHLGVPSQRSSIVIQRSGPRAHQKWKGPDKISRIYGDLIDDIEYNLGLLACKAMRSLTLSFLELDRKIDT